jgi:hypothetical protein
MIRVGQQQRTAKLFFKPTPLYIHSIEQQIHKLPDNKE